MIAVIQRVTSASVTVDEQIIAEIGVGMLVLAAIEPTDTQQQLSWMANKLTTLRIFRAGEKHFDQDVSQIGGSILLISQFTLAADARQGRRPSLSGAASPEVAGKLFDQFTDLVTQTGIPVRTGRFGANMQVSLTNDGPATFLLRTEQ